MFFDQWPDVPHEVLLWGWFENYPRPSFLYLPTEPDWAEWRRRELQRLERSKSVIGVIPIYADNTDEDIMRVLRRIHQAKHVLELKHRARPDKYAKRLKVWDTYRECGSFAEVAARLCMKVSTVKTTYATVARDIFGHPDRRTRRERLLDNFNGTNHWAVCSTCSQATTADEFC